MKSFLFAAALLTSTGDIAQTDPAMTTDPAATAPGSQVVAEYPHLDRMWDYDVALRRGTRIENWDEAIDRLLWLRDERLIPLQDLFAVDRDSPIYNETSRRGAFYAESWGLLHYLMQGNEERRAQFSRATCRTSSLKF